MKKSLVLAVATLACSAMPSFADVFGTQVTGFFASSANPAFNLFDPAQGYVSPGYDNYALGTTVTIDNGVEFGVTDGSIFYSFDFTGNTLTFSNTNPYGIETPTTITFTDPAFTGFSLVSNSAGLTYSFSGDTLTLQNPGQGSSGTTVFSYGASSVTPEPGSFLLLGTGLGTAGVLRRRLKA